MLDRYQTANLFNQVLMYFIYVLDESIGNKTGLIGVWHSIDGALECFETTYMHLLKAKVFYVERNQGIG